MRLVDIIIQLE